MGEEAEKKNGYVQLNYGAGQGKGDDGERLKEFRKKVRMPRKPGGKLEKATGVEFSEGVKGSGRTKSWKKKGAKVEGERR